MPLALRLILVFAGAVPGWGGCGVQAAEEKTASGSSANGTFASGTHAGLRGSGGAIERRLDVSGGGATCGWPIDLTMERDGR